MVIVVIAILAAISIVAYTNIQDRAKDTARISTSKQIEKSTLLKGTFTGQYSATASERASKESFLSAYDITSLEDQIQYGNCPSECGEDKIYLHANVTYGGKTYPPRDL